MTWKTISEVVCKSSSKRVELEKIIVDAKIITDKIEICNEFNKFFTKIGPKLADKINTENKKMFWKLLKKIAFLPHLHLTWWKHCYKNISTLQTKNSYGHDRIPMKLLKFILPAVIKPLALVINQSLATGIFQEKIKNSLSYAILQKRWHHSNG